MAELRNFRNGARSISPRWLSTGRAFRILYVVGLHIDAILDAFVAALKHKLPGATTRTDSLGVVGVERKMIRGLNETDANYTQRLRGYLTAHKHRGSSYELLRQIRIYFAPTYFKIALVYASGRVLEQSTAGVITEVSPASALIPQWARQNLIYSVTPSPTPDGTWGSAGVWDDGVWGSDLTPAEVANYRSIPSAWTAAHMLTTITILDSTTELWGYPVGLWGDAGTWGSGTGIAVTFAV